MRGGNQRGGGAENKAVGMAGCPRGWPDVAAGIVLATKQNQNEKGKKDAKSTVDNIRYATRAKSS